MSTTTSIKRAPIAYFAEFGLAMALFVATMLLRGRFADTVSDPRERLALLAMPIVPIWLALLAVVRHYRRIDEMAKLVLVRNLALAAGLTACTVLSYGLLTDAGFAPLPVSFAWPIMAAFWGLSTAVSEWRAR